MNHDRQRMENVVYSTMILHYLCVCVLIVCVQCSGKCSTSHCNVHCVFQYLLRAEQSLMLAQWRICLSLYSQNGEDPLA